MKALVKWFDGFDIRLPFVSIKFKKPNRATNSTLATTTGLNKFYIFNKAALAVAFFLLQIDVQNYCV